jgi:hypothetical protein
MPELTPESAVGAAFSKLKLSVSSNDAHVFATTSLEDVWRAAEEVEKGQRNRRDMRNLAKIKPLLEALDKYSTTLGILCNGTPYLSWVWVGRLETLFGISTNFDGFLGSNQANA